MKYLLKDIALMPVRMFLSDEGLLFFGVYTFLVALCSALVYCDIIGCPPNDFNWCIGIAWSIGFLGYSWAFTGHKWFFGSTLHAKVLKFAQ